VHSKVITSSSDYTSKHQELGVSASVSGSWGGFSAAVSAAYSSVNTDVDSHSGSTETVNTNERKFHPGFLQLFLVVKKIVNIDGTVGKTVDKELIDSVPVEQPLTAQQLTDRSKNYLLWLMGDDIGIIEGALSARFSETRCLGRGSPVANIGKLCWNECNDQQGYCDWCGTYGLCCSRTLADGPSNGCDGKLGSKNSFICATKIPFFIK